MRYVKYAILVIIGVGLLTVSMANLQPVGLRLLPDDMAALLGVNYEIELPLFLVIMGGLVTGLLIGFIWEWLREHRHRAAAARARAEARKLERKLAENGGTRDKTDDVLAILDDTGKGARTA